MKCIELRCKKRHNLFNIFVEKNIEDPSQLNMRGNVKCRDSTVAPARIVGRHIMISIIGNPVTGYLSISYP